MNFVPAYDDRYLDHKKFEPLKWITESVKENVWFFWEKLKWILKKSFNPFSESKKPGFSWLFWNTISSWNSNSKSFENLQPNIVTEKEVVKNLDISNLKETQYTIKSNDFILDSNSNFFSWTWNYIETFKQNTKIYSSTTRKIYSINWEAYIFIDWHNNTSDKKFTLESWYIRASWLDLQINSIFNKDLSDDSKVLKKSFEPKRNIFSWYMWPNWEEIPEYIIKAVTINYFGKIIKPKIESDLLKTDIEISQTREILIKDVINNKENTQKSDLLIKQKQKISRKHKLSAISKAIDEAYSWKQDSIMKPEVADIILTMQKRPEWNNIILKSYEVKNKKRKQKYFK